MIEGIKKIREALRKITTGLRKDGTINVHPECESYIKEKLEEGERHTNKKIEVPGEAIIFADGEKVAKLTNIKNVQMTFFRFPFIRSCYFAVSLCCFAIILCQNKAVIL
mgnify:CR=1 FL=1